LLRAECSVTAYFGVGARPRRCKLLRPRRGGHRPSPPPSTFQRALFPARFAKPFRRWSSALQPQGSALSALWAGFFAESKDLEPSVMIELRGCIGRGGSSELVCSAWLFKSTLEERGTSFRGPHDAGLESSGFLRTSCSSPTLGETWAKKRSRSQDARPRRWDRAGAIAPRRASKRSERAQQLNESKSWRENIQQRALRTTCDRWGRPRESECELDKNLAGKICYRPQ
jgi:hypothetical protein